MLAQETLVGIHVLHRQDNSIRAIAKELDISRSTARRYLWDLAPVYPRREPRAATNEVGPLQRLRRRSYRSGQASLGTGIGAAWGDPGSWL